MATAPLPESLRDHLRARLPEVITGLRALVRDHAPDALTTREAGYSIRNAADEAVVRIYDEIWWLGVNAQDFVRELDDVTAPKMRVEINSPGGDVFDGIAIYNAIRSHPAYVTTRVDGLAASIASVIAQAGDQRLIQPAGQLMIHNAWGLVIGDTNDHADMADVLKQQDAVIANIYAAHSGKPADRFRELMNADTWLTAEMAVDEGLADEIVEAAPKQQPQDANRPPLHAQISDAVLAVQEAITRADEVRALRSDAGKDLSNAIADSLLGLRDSVTQLDALLTPQNSSDDAAAVWTADELALLRARLTVAERAVA